MNKDRRKRIADIVVRLEEMRDEFESILVEVENVISDERDYFYKLPEKAQGGKIGLATEGIIDKLDESLTLFEDFHADDIIHLLESAAG